MAFSKLRDDQRVEAGALSTPSAQYIRGPRITAARPRSALTAVGVERAHVHRQVEDDNVAVLPMASEVDIAAACIAGFYRFSIDRQASRAAPAGNAEGQAEAGGRARPP